MEVNNPNDTITGMTKEEFYQLVFQAVLDALIESNRINNTNRADQVAQMLKDRAQLLKG